MQLASIERRIHRLAVLLLGDHERAASAVDAVLAARAFEPAQVDRLTILRTREVPDHDRRGCEALDAVGPDVARGLGALDYQAREAWVLAMVLGLPLREVARAMDCSRSAARLHLDRALVALGDAAPTARHQMRAAIVRVDVPARHRRRRQVRRRARRVGRVLLIVAAVVLLVLASVTVASRWDVWTG